MTKLRKNLWPNHQANSPPQNHIKSFCFALWDSWGVRMCDLYGLLHRSGECCRRFILCLLFSCISDSWMWTERCNLASLSGPSGEKKISISHCLMENTIWCLIMSLKWHLDLITFEIEVENFCQSLLRMSDTFSKMYYWMQVIIPLYYYYYYNIQLF